MAHMTNVDAATLGDRVRAARERAGLTQAELAQQVALERTVVSKIESGTRRVSALELADISEALGIRMAVLFQDPIPALVSHRSNQGLEVVDSQIDRVLAELATEVEFVQSLSPGLLVPPASPGNAWKHPVSNEDAEQFAEEIRKVLSLNDSEPLHDLAGRVADVGLWAFARNLGVDVADAGTVLLADGAVALVNSNNKVGRRRLALAHELGHYFLQDEYTIDWRVSDGGVGLESRLDRFARALLLPSVGLARMWNEELGGYGRRERAIVTASHFQVDMTTLARRVSELGLDGDPNEIRLCRPTRGDFVEFGLHPEPQELADISLPLPFQRAVVQLYRAEKIGIDRALDLLQGTYGESDLPPRRQGIEQDLWQYVS